MRKFLLFIIASLFTITSLAQSGTIGQLSWSISSGKLTISGKGDMPYLPYDNTEYKYYSSSITSVVIGTGITSISEYAFSSFSGLNSVTIPSSVTNIESGAFYKCSALTSVTIPNGVNAIKKSTFNDCSSLISVNIPNSVTYIEDFAFSGCGNLTSITIPNLVTRIGAKVFYGCFRLTSVNIPSSVTYIGDSAFSGCSGLTSVSIPSSITNIADNTFKGCRSLTSVTIPNSVTHIGDSAFSGCIGLTSVATPTTGDSAFSDCSGLTSVTFTEITSINKFAFFNCSALTSVTIPKGATYIGASAFSNCTGLTSLTIPSSVTNIESGAFSGCNSLQNITVAWNVPSSVWYGVGTNSGYISFSINKATCTLHVPTGTEDDYSATKTWQGFNMKAYSGVDLKPVISYNKDVLLTYAVGYTINPLHPTNAGGVATNYSIAPSLPIGLSLNSSTGVISGKPTIDSPQTSYTITATNSYGSSKYPISITVKTLQIITVPSSNFSIVSKGESCQGENNGEISITSSTTYPFIANINGQSYSFTGNKLTVANLAPGTYNVSITIPGYIFEQNFTIVIAKATTITGKLSLASNKVSVKIEQGTAPYTVFVNGLEQFETFDSNFSFELANGGAILEVKTAKVCEGIYTEDITGLEGSVFAVPNPSSGSFEIALPISKKDVVIALYASNGQMISNQTYTVENGRAKLSLEGQVSGAYVAKILLDTPCYLKIIKK